jgi:hypothetical protein
MNRALSTRWNQSGPDTVVLVSCFNHDGTASDSPFKALMFY